jgi:hypothetical protein
MDRTANFSAAAVACAGWNAAEVRPRHKRRVKTGRRMKTSPVKTIMNDFVLHLRRVNGGLAAKL